MKGREERSNYPCLLVCSFVSPSFFLPIVLTKYKNQIKTGKEMAEWRVRMLGSKWQQKKSSTNSFSKWLFEKQTYEVKNRPKKFKKSPHTLDNRTIQKEQKFLIIWNNGVGALLKINKPQRWSNYIQTNRLINMEKQTGENLQLFMDPAFQNLLAS